MHKVLRLVIVLSCLTLLLGCAQETEDTTAPTTPTNLTKTTPDIDNTPTFEWDASTDEGSGIGCYLVRIPENPFYEYWIFNGILTSFPCDAPLSDGSYTFEVKALDKAMNESAAATLTFTIDTSAPVIQVGHSRKYPAPIGTTVTVEFLEYFSDGWNTVNASMTVLEITRGEQAWNIMKTIKSYSDPPPSGYDYVFVKLRFEYLAGPTPESDFDSFYFYLISSEGVEVSSNNFYLYQGLDVAVPEPSQQTVYPGATTEGWELLLAETIDPSPVMTFRTADGGIWFKLYS